jgi:hypothetical protein
MFDLNQFVDRGRPGRMITQGGFTSHAQACARMEGEQVLFLLLVTSSVTVEKSPFPAQP